MAVARVSRHAGEAVRRGHPWIFRSAVGQVSSREEQGLIVRIVAEHDGQREAVLGAGVFDPISPIAIRVWSVGADARLDAGVFRERLVRAIALRGELFADGATDAYRVLNGEGDRTPGIVVDRYADVAVLRIDGDATRAVSPLLLTSLEPILRDAGVTTLLERIPSRDAGGRDTTVAVRFGPERSRVVVREHGVPFVVDVARGQKTGAFLDQRENRRRVGELVAARARAGLGTRTLNLFSYTGGFSQRAALAGATVTSVDVAAKAHATAQESFRLAGLDPAEHTFVTADAFAWLAEAKRKGQTWDVVISDPPSFAPSERAKPKAISAYRALHRSCADVLAPGGRLVAASCSSHVSLEDFLSTLDDAALGRSDLRVLESFGPPPDHPTVAPFFEGRYLKLAMLA
ncbi:MAG: class I SAM-dependent rRNA methyltransferase [Labilithrix sp.]|nr:class I SAM-dependent rRNA methyltransferase [Labilithrix sp.]